VAVWWWLEVMRCSGGEVLIWWRLDLELAWLMSCVRGFSWIFDSLTVFQICLDL
jgi:hypothetical protein